MHRVSGITVRQGDLSSIGSPGNKIILHERASAADVLRTSEVEGVKGHILPITGEYSHSAWAVEYLDSTAIAVADSVPVGVRVWLNPVAGLVSNREAWDPSERLAPAMLPQMSYRPSLRAQLARPSDVVLAIRAGLDGIGEVKAEILDGAAAGSDSLLATVEGRTPWRDIPVRFFDWTEDKSRDGQAAASPLGNRGVRLALAEPSTLEDYVNLIPEELQPYVICILPMVTSAQEVVDVRRMLDGAIPRVGALIETPAAALDAHSIASASDMVLVGPSDLAQYSFAWSREIPSGQMVTERLHPTVLQLLRMVADACHTARVKWGMPVDWVPSVDLISQIGELQPDFLAVSPHRARAWQSVIPGRGMQ